MSVVVTPDRSNRSVISEDKLEAYLGRGYLTDEDFQKEVRAKDEANRLAWAASPETLPERFAMLRAERDWRLARTDYLLQADYPLEAALRQKLIVYRQALRDLPGLPDAPWDGGGDATPWPASPLA